VTLQRWTASAAPAAWLVLALGLSGVAAAGDAPPPLPTSAPPPLPADTAAADVLLHQRLDVLLVQLQDPLNETRASPGAQLLGFPPRAATWFSAILDARTDLTWQAQYALHRAILCLQSPAPVPVLPGGPPMHQPARDFYTMVMAGYTQGSDHNPTWDPLVAQAVQWISLSWQLDPGHPGDAEERARDLLQQAYALGCRDPYIEYLLATVLQDIRGDDTPTAQPLLRDAGLRILHSHYDDDCVLHVLWHHLKYVLAQQQNDPSGTEDQLIKIDMDALPALIGRGLSEPVVRANSVPYLLQSYASILKSQNPGHEQEAIDACVAAIQAEHPAHPIGLLVKAYYMQDWAWDARGSGWASSVTPQGAQLMQDRMAVAETCVHQALREDPENTCPLMVAIDLANGANTPKDQVWAWFNRAQALEPGQTTVLDGLANYLDPRWNGSADELISLGRAALATGDWTYGTPDTLIEIHHTLSHFSKGSWQEEEDADYFRAASVWTDYQAVFVGQLAAYPEDQANRSLYCYDAYRVGHIALARAQFHLLTQPNIAMFGGEDSYAFVKESLFPTGAGLSP